MTREDFENGYEPLTQEELKEHIAELKGEPAIYVGTYGKYAGGSINGAWIDLTSFYDYEDFCEFCYRLHIDEDDPEFMVQDFECFPKSWYCESGLPDEETFEKIQEYAEMSESDQEAYELWLDNYDSNASVDDFQDHYVGYYDSGEDFAEQLYYELYEIPSHLDGFIDWKAVWRNLDTGGDYTEFDGHIFRCY